MCDFLMLLPLMPLEEVEGKVFPLLLWLSNKEFHLSGWKRNEKSFSRNKTLNNLYFSHFPGEFVLLEFNSISMKSSGSAMRLRVWEDLVNEKEVSWDYFSPESSLNADLWFIPLLRGGRRRLIFYDSKNRLRQRRRR